MKKLTFALLIAVLLLHAFSLATLAAGTIPPGAVGACPPGFEFMDASHLSHDPGDMHLHAGIQVDLNGDGWVCMKHVTPTEKVHVHVDNNLPLP